MIFMGALNTELTEKAPSTQRLQLPGALVIAATVGAC